MMAMRRLLPAILWLSGIVTSLDYPYEYEYMYEGKTFLGIPGINNQSAGLIFKANVTIQAKSERDAIFKLTAIETKEYNGEIAFEYPPNMEYIEILKMPFGVNFAATEPNTVMIVPNEDIEFITNIRKAIAEIFRVPPYDVTAEDTPKGRHHNNPAIDNGSFMEAKTMLEGTLFGVCQSFYTFNIYTTNVKKQINTFSNVTRSINLDDCKDLVTMKRTSTSNFDNSGKSKFGSVQSRSSVGQYYIQVVNGRGRFLEASVVGDVVLNPFGLDGEQMIAKTKKRIKLIVAKKITTPIPLPRPSKARNVVTWSYEVATTHPLSTDAKRWVNYHKGTVQYPVSESFLTGVSTNNMIIYNRCMLFISSLLQKAIYIIVNGTSIPNPNDNSPWDEVGAVDATLLMEATKVVRVLKKRDIENLFSNRRHTIPEHQDLYRDLLVDVLAASGSDNSVGILLQKISAGEISETRAASVFLTIANQFFDPDMMKEIMDFLMKLQFTKRPLLYSTAYVNYAALVRKVCLNPDTSPSAVQWPLFGNGSRCTDSLILDIGMFEELLEAKLEFSENNLEKAVVMQTLSNLGSTICLSIFEKVIFDVARHGTTLRTLAIYALEMDKMKEPARDKVFPVLMRVFNDVAMGDEIRQAAFVTMVTWGPDSGWWQSIAKGTWRERSIQLSSFISFTLKSLSRATSPQLSEQAKIASFALVLAKPVPPSFRHSYNYIFAKYLNQKKVDTRFHFEYLANPSSNIPKELYTQFSLSFGGYDVNLFETALTSFDIDSTNSSTPPHNESSGWVPCEGTQFGSDPRIPKLFKMVEESRKAENISMNVVREQRIDLLLRAFDNMYSYTDATFTELFEKRSTQNGTYVKYFHPISSEIFFPTELGLPLITEITLSTVLFNDYISEIHGNQNDRPHLNLNLNLMTKGDLKLVAKLLPRMKVYIPWAYKTIMVGVDNVKKLRFPGKLKLGFHVSNSSTSVGMEVEPNMKEKFSAAYAHNIPFVCLKPLFPGRNLPEESNLLVLLQGKSPSLQRSVDFDLSETGFQINLEFQGDTKYPFTSAKFMEMIRNPVSLTSLLTSPSSKFWKASLNLVPSTSNMKSASIVIGKAYNVDPSDGHGDNGNGPNVQPNCPANLEESISENLKMLKRIPPKIKNELNEELHINMNGLAMSASFVDTGSCVRLHSILANWGKNKFRGGRTARTFKAAYTYLKTEEPVWQELWGLSGVADIPIVDNYEDFTKALQANQMNVKTVGNAILGDLKKVEEIASFEGHMGLSDERRRQILDDIHHGCLSGPDAPLEDIHTSLEYDEMDLTLSIKKPDAFTASMTNFTYQLENTVQGSYFPSVETNLLQVNNSKNKISFSARRTFASPDYQLWIRSQKENILVEDFQFPWEGFNQLGSYSMIEDEVIKATKEIEMNYNKSYSCRIDREKMTTYDGLAINFPAIPCEVVTAYDVTTLFDWIITTQLNEKNEMELTLYSNDRCAILKISRNNITFDLEPVSVSITHPVYQFYDNYGNIFLVITLVRDEEEGGVYFYRVTYAHVAIFEIRKDSIVITPELRMRDVLRGTCGNFDGIPENDNVGVQRCIYDMTNQGFDFGVSWVYTDVATDRCNRDRRVSTAMGEVNEIRKKCKKVPIQ